MATIVKKLSAKSIGVDFVKAKKEPQDCYQILGYVTDIQEGVHSTNGEWQKLVGQFEATNLNTGEVINSSEAFLPDVANKIIASQVKEGAKIQFALVVGTKPNETPTGYEYTVRELIESEPLEVIEKIRAQITGNVLSSSRKKKQLN